MSIRVGRDGLRERSTRKRLELGDLVQPTAYRDYHHEILQANPDSNSTSDGM